MAPNQPRSLSPKPPDPRIEKRGGYSLLGTKEGNRELEEAGLLWDPAPSLLISDWWQRLAPDGGAGSRTSHSSRRGPSRAVGVSRWAGARALASEDRKGGGAAAARAPGTCAPQAARIAGPLPEPDPGCLCGDRARKRRSR